MTDLLDFFPIPVEVVLERFISPFVPFEIFDTGWYVKDEGVESDG